MTQHATLTVKVLSDEDLSAFIPKQKELTQAQKDMIAFIAREAVRDYIEQREKVASQLEGDRIIRLVEVSKLTGLGRTTIYKKMNEGSFPASIPLGTRSVGWRRSGIERWMEDQERRP